MEKLKTILIAVLATVIILFVALYIIGSVSEKPKTPTPQPAAPAAQAPTPKTAVETAQPSAPAAEVSLPQTFDNPKAGYTMN